MSAAVDTVRTLLAISAHVFREEKDLRRVGSKPKTVEWTLISNLGGLASGLSSVSGVS